LSSLCADFLLVSNVHRRHRRHCRCCLAATSATVTTMIELTVIHSQRKRQQQCHHQRTNGDTNVKMFTSTDDLDLFNLSTVFEVHDVDQGEFSN
jgi:hypothetical protein